MARDNLYKNFYKHFIMLFLFSGCGGGSDLPKTLPEHNVHEITYVEKFISIEKSSEEIKITHIPAIPVIRDYVIKDPLFAKQWYLQKNENCDINISDVWKMYRGQGVKIAVVDTGIEAKHPDLKVCIDLNLSYCYENGTSDPSPTKAELYNPSIDATHGTAVSGIIAAQQNEIGVSGIAPEATLVGLNVFSNPEDSVFENAMLYSGVDISSNSWGSDLRNGVTDDRIVLDAIIQKMQQEPLVYIFAAGNEHTNTNFSSVLNSRYTFPVGAVTIEGEIASYSNYGANLLVMAPGGGGVFSEKKIVTTDLTTAEYGYDSYKREHFDVKGNENFDYTNQMNGTSAAVPIVSGVVALMLEANPKLTYRDIRDIIARTSTRVDDTHPSWQRNGAGLWFSPYYGFGLINAGKAVTMAQNYRPMPPETTVSKMKKTLHIAIPDNDDSGIVVPVEVAEEMVVEYVEVTLRTDHTYSGDLRITLQSPAGTSSTLAYGKTITDDYYLPWTFASLQFYGETSQGKWEFSVADLMPKNSGELQEVTLTFYGHKK